MVTVAATGAGLALPLLGAGAAHAADAGTWDRVAMCESGGMWNADTHNGFYGGLAITQDTWSQYGGTAYAPRPDMATRAQQITVAEKVLADLGPDAWPGCDKTTGLVGDTRKPDVDPGSTAPTTVTPPPATPADPGTPATPTTPGTPADTGTPAATPTTPATPTAPGKPTTPTTAPTTPAPPAAGTPTDPGAGTSTPPPADPGTPTQSVPPAASTAPTAPSTPADGGGRHARPYSPSDEALAVADRASRTETTGVTAKASDANDPGNTGNTDTAPDTVPGTYKVGAGDSLSGIAADQDVAGGWARLYDANHQVIGDNPNLIKPGQILDLG
ncbi:Transglycosylase-like domain-containing protein [Actinacidiphila paucisporea]|uniref:Transglycosylase-like domain-containing protein n=2 Tax=Actinacidiphila paucisporea TaxID=310782 RepID=A0A1M7F5H9_9ACTN|nr:Transglycosylase-like domain-containing protein [Actinacidiphila paucisporea]